MRNRSRGHSYSVSTAASASSVTHHPGSADELTPRGRQITLFICCLALFVSTLDNTIANVALPSIGRDLHTGSGALQWTIDAYIVVRGALLLSAGALGDRFGRRRMFRFGMAGFAAGSLLCSVAPNVELLIAARVIQALGGCLLVPSSLAIIADTFPDQRERARAIGIWGATTGVSTGIGPLVGGVLVETVGWRSIFWINLPICAIAVLLATRYLPKSRARKARSMDVPGQLLVLVVLVAITSGFIEASEGSWTSSTVLGLLAVGVVALGAFLAVESRREEPLVELRVFRSPMFAGASALAVLAFLVFAGFLFVNTVYLQEIRGLSPIEAGLILMPSTIGNVLLAPLSGRITADRGGRLPVTLAMGLMLVGSVVLAFAARDVSLVVLAVAYTAIGSGVGLVNAPITNAGVSSLPRDQAGVAGAMTSTFRQVGSSLGVALLGALTFSGFAGSLGDRLLAAGVSGTERARVLAEGSGRGGSGGGGGLGIDLGSVSGPVREAVDAAFMGGLHHAYIAAAVIAAVGVVVGAVAFRPGQAGGAGEEVAGAQAG